MDTADKIGLLPGFDWTAGHSLLVTIIIAWLATPGLMIALGAIGESRWIPLWSERQFRSFFPGDLFLGIAVASLLTMAQSLPDTERWYNATWWHLTVLIGAAIVAGVMTWLERDAYPKRALLSPTKIYHNGVLYVGYGYVGFTTAIAVIFGAPSWYLLVPILFGGVGWHSLPATTPRTRRWPPLTPTWRTGGRSGGQGASAAAISEQGLPPVSRAIQVRRDGWFVISGQIYEVYWDKIYGQKTTCQHA